MVIEDESLASLDVSRADRFASGAHWPLFERLRREAPIHHCPNSAYGAYWSITRLADIIAVETDTETFSSHDNIIINDVPVEFRTPAFATFDPPAHTRERLAAAPALSPPRLARLESEIRTKIAGILDTLPLNATFDWANQVSVPITNSMAAALFDWPRSDAGGLSQYCEVMTTTPRLGAIVESFAQRDTMLASFKTQLLDMWRARVNGDGDDVLSNLAQHPNTCDMADDPERILGAVTLIAGANEAARGALSGGVLAFHEHPEQWALLRREPTLISSAVSEIVRWQSPISHMRRTTTRVVTLHGKHIEKGARVVLWYCSGNRDESVFENAADFRIDRVNVRRHVGYGFGIHRCFGRRAAELEMTILWEEVMKRFSRVEVVGEPKRFQSNFAAGFEHLPVRLHSL